MNKTSTFVKVYKRESQSPFDDHSTMLWFATVSKDNDGNVKLYYDRYISVHRHVNGKILGISVSKQMLADNPEFETRYLSGTNMYAFLMLHIEEITEFCELFKDDFEAMFLLKPNDYFNCAERYWTEKSMDGQ